MTEKILTQTDLAHNSKVFRLKRTIRSRYSFFERKATYHMRENPRLTIHEPAFRNYLLHLDSLLSKLEGVGFNYNTNKAIGDRIKADDTYLEIYREVSKWPTREQHFEDVLFLLSEGYAYGDDLTDHILAKMSESAKIGCITRTNARLYNQFCESFSNNEFMVFSTLTVLGDYYEDVFKKGSDHWRNYIRSIDRLIAKQCHGSVRNAKGKNYHNYLAVVEEGSENERLHIHVLHFFRDIADFWKAEPIGSLFADPNQGMATSERREIEELRRLWPYGLSSHIAVRFSSGDAWGRLGWRWPTEQGIPIEGTNINKMSSYMLKYLTKAKRIEVTGETETWKIRTNHQMGKWTLNSLMEKLSHSHLESLIAYKSYPAPILIWGKPCPNKIIRTLAVKELFNRLKNQNPEEITLPKNTALNELMQCTSQKKNSRNYANIGSLLATLYGNTDTSSQHLMEWVQAKRQLERYTPAPDHSSQSYSGNAWRS